MPRPAKPYAATLAQVDIARDGESAIIAYRDGQAATTHLHLGPELANMTDQQVLDRFNEIIRAREAWAAENPYVAVEVPPGSPQIRYFAPGDQWTPRGGVLRCLIEDGPEGEVSVEIDGRALSMEEFGRLLLTYAGWGMRICFVPDNELEHRPAIEVREPAEP